MKINILKSDQFKSQPWKNGGGSTLELFKYPDVDNYDLRLSIAQIDASGPFSKFEGYDRTIIQLDGPQIELTHPELEKVKILELGSPYHFKGEWVTHCKVTTRSRDFNVIYKKSSISVQTKVVKGSINADQTLPSSAFQVIAYCLNGSVNVVSNRENNRTVIKEHELCILSKSTEAEQISLFSEHDAGAYILMTIDGPLRFFE
jgi:environmental stress-induced protein Ves